MHRNFLKSLLKKEETTHDSIFMLLLVHGKMQGNEEICKCTYFSETNDMQRS